MEISRLVKRRLIKESKKAVSMGHYISMDLSIPEVNIYPLVFQITAGYPFHPPVVRTIKGASYLKLLKDATIILRLEGCLCCASILCKDTWSPSHSLIDVVKELYSVKALVNTHVSVLIMHNWLDILHMGFVDLAPYLYMAKDLSQKPLTC
jgi:hypothetical protein